MPLERHDEHLHEGKLVSSTGLEVKTPGRDVLEFSGKVSPLSDELYNHVFNNRFVPNSTEYTDPETKEPGPMLYETRRILHALPHLRRFASVGTGTGFFDANLLHHIPLDKYVGIEPNPHHADQILDNIAQEPWRSTNIVRAPFDRNFSRPDVRPGTFDAMLWTHCAYFMKDPVADIQHGLTYLSKDGALIILHQTEKGVCEFFRHFERRLGLEWPEDAVRQDHGMSTATLSEALRAAGVRHFTGERPAHLYVDDFHGDQVQEKEAALEFASFFMNTDVRHYPLAAQDEMIDWVRQRSMEKTNGRHAFHHPQGFIVVPHPASALQMEDMDER